MFFDHSWTQRKQNLCKQRSRYATLSNLSKQMGHLESGDASVGSLLVLAFGEKLLSSENCLSAEVMFAAGPSLPVRAGAAAAFSRWRVRQRPEPGASRRSSPGGRRRRVPSARRRNGSAIGGGGGGSGVTTGTVAPRHQRGSARPPRCLPGVKCGRRCLASLPLPRRHLAGGRRRCRAEAEEGAGPAWLRRGGGTRALSAAWRWLLSCCFPGASSSTGHG